MRKDVYRVVLVLSVLCSSFAGGCDNGSKSSFPNPPGTRAVAPPRPLEEAASSVDYDSDGRVVAVSFWGRNVTDADIAQLRPQATMQHLTLQECPYLTRETLEHLSSLPNLISLRLLHVPFTDEDLRYLRSLPRLSELRLQHTRITGSGLKELAELPLERLDLAGATLTPRGLAVLTELPGLTELHINSPKLDLAELPSLGSLQRLERLNLRGLAVSDTSLEKLDGLNALRYLDFDSDSITDRGLVPLGRLAGLEQLNLADAKITDDGLSALRSLAALRILTLGAGITDRGLRHLSDSTALEQLRLEAATVSGEGLIHLQGLSNLKTLDLRKDKLNSAGRRAIDEFKQAVPNCEIVIWETPLR